MGRESLPSEHRVAPTRDRRSQDRGRGGLRPAPIFPLPPSDPRHKEPRSSTYDRWRRERVAGRQGARLLRRLRNGGDGLSVGGRREPVFGARRVHCQKHGSIGYAPRTHQLRDRPRNYTSNSHARIVIERAWNEMATSGTEQSRSRKLGIYALSEHRWCGVFFSQPGVSIAGSRSVTG